MKPTPNGPASEMSRPAINFILDCTLLAVFVVLMWTTALLAFIFPSGTQAAGWSLWGLDYNAWHRVQTGCFVVFSLGILLHLILHWTWACGFVASRLARVLGRPVPTNEATRTLYGVTMLAVILMVLGTLLLLGELQMREPG